MEHAWFFWLLVPAVVIGLLLASSARERFGRERRLERSQRRSIELRAIEQRHAELEVENARLLEVLGHRHDARSAVAAAGPRGADRQRPALPTELAGRVRARAGLRSTRAGVPGAESEAAPSPAAEAPVAVLPVVHASVGALRLRHPSTELAASGDESAALVVGGGEYRQIVDHLVANACEGDGRRAAGAVEVRVEASGLAHTWPSWCRTTARILDRAALDPLARSRPRRTATPGSGLYTVERLVRASRGSLRLENRREGGWRHVPALHGEVAPGTSPADPEAAR